MNKFKKLFVVFLFAGYSSFAQTTITVHKFDSIYQACLDKGQFMAGCSHKYYNELDSMLYVVYKMARVRLDTSVRWKLNNEQKQWIADRDKYFNKVETEHSELEGQDREMDVADKKAGFIRKRVIELLTRLIY